MLLAFEKAGLFTLNVETLEYEKLSFQIEEEVLSLLKDNEGNIWIGTDTDGLYVLDSTLSVVKSLKHKSEDVSAISSNVIWDMALSNNGKIWLATDRGLNLLDPKSFNATSFQYDFNNPSAISSNFLLSVFEEDDERLWIGTSESGLNIVHPSKRAFEHFTNRLSPNRSLSNNAVWSINEDDYR